MDSSLDTSISTRICHNFRTMGVSFAFHGQTHGGMHHNLTGTLALRDSSAETQGRPTTSRPCKLIEVVETVKLSGMDLC